MARWTLGMVLLVFLIAAGLGSGTSMARIGDLWVARAAAMPTEAEARAIFYAVLKERSAAVENGLYSRIEPLYAHDETIVVFRPDLVMHGWKSVEAYWKTSLGRPRTEPFRVYWNDDLTLTLTDDLIVGGLTWSNQSGQDPRRYGCLSLALRRYGQRWLIVHEHSSNWTKAPA